MKKLLIAFMWLTLIPALCFGGSNNVMIVSVPGAAPASPCPTGTYSFAWDGLYTADNDKACYNSGDSNENGTQSGGTLSGSVFTRTGLNQYVTWAATSGANVGIDDELGTVWMTVTATLSAGGYVFESINGADNIKIEIYSTGAVIGYHNGENVFTSDLVPTGTPTRIAYSWNAATNFHAVKVGTGSWVAANETVNPWAGTPDDITIGENVANGSGGDTIAIRDVYIINSYQAADPAPL